MQAELERIDLRRHPVRRAVGRGVRRLPSGAVLDGSGSPGRRGRCGGRPSTAHAPDLGGRCRATAVLGPDRGRDRPRRRRQESRRLIFILSPPRSGTTLLRSCWPATATCSPRASCSCSASPRSQDRAAAYTGRFSPWLDGAIRTVMEIEGLDADGAKASCTRRRPRASPRSSSIAGSRTRSRRGSSWTSRPRTRWTRRRFAAAEADFDGALYIHLVRHPVPMIDSFERHHMEQILYLERPPVRAPAARRARLDAESPDDPRVPGRRAEGALVPPGVRGPGDRSRAQMEALCRRLGPRLRSGHHAAVREAWTPRWWTACTRNRRRWATRASLPTAGSTRGGRRRRSIAPTVPLGDADLELAARLGYDLSTDGSADRRTRRDALARQRDLRRSAGFRRNDWRARTGS